MAGNLGSHGITFADLAGGLVMIIFLIGFVIIFAVLTFLTVLIIAPFAQPLTPHLLS